MADPPWRVEVVPVHRAGWSDAGVGDAAQAGLGHAAQAGPVTISQPRATDLILVALVVVALVVVLLKPWGVSGPADAPPGAPNVAEGRVPAAPEPAAPAPAAPVTAEGAVAPLVAVQPPVLPDDVFAPPARACIEDLGWRVCVLATAGDSGQVMYDYFAPDAAPLSDQPGPRQVADPLVVLATAAGATITFYPPGGFYIPDAQSLPIPTPQPGGAPVIANGPVTVEAWWVDRAVSKELTWLSAGAVVHGGRVAANVLIPAQQDFSGLSAWRPGRYVIRVAGVGSRSWELSFDFVVTAT